MSQLAYSLLFAPNVLVALTVLAVMLLLLKCRIVAIFCLVTGLAWVGIWSLPITTQVAGGWLENRYEQRTPDAYPETQAIIVLGGHIQGNRRNWFEPYDREAVISRESLAAALYVAKRAPLIILSGGAQVGNISDIAGMTRSLLALGIDPAVIIKETQSQSTLENAQLTHKALNALGIKSALLVTSALHMPRAVAAFETTTTQVIAAPLPPQIQFASSSPYEPWVPNLHTLLASQAIIKEYAGLIIYWLQTLWP